MTSNAAPGPALLAPLVSKTNPDVKIPRIIYGTAWKKERSSMLVQQVSKISRISWYKLTFGGKKALQAGFRGVDTAAQPRHYNEALVGDGINKSLSNEGIRREDLYVSS
jgi:diketogulonate reductase-like aldo/keto reductase